MGPAKLEDAAKLVDAVSNQTDSVVDGDTKSGEKSNTAGDIDGSTNKKADVAHLVNGSPSGGKLNVVIGSSTTLEEVPAFGVEEASSCIVDGDNAIDVNNASSNGDDSQHPPENPTHLDGEADLLEASQQPEQEPFPEDDDYDDDEGWRRDSELFEEPAADSAQARERRKRYELSYWPYHLLSAEKLWTPEEREKSDEWKGLQKLVIQFLCESPDAFKEWQDRYMELDEDYEAHNTLLRPLQVAAAYGIPGLVKTLLDRGEPAAGESEDGRSALWFAAVSNDVEVFKLILERGASPNARKDFPPPFHVLLWRNPKLQFVNLIVEHGADCKIMNRWGFNVMHWFA